MYINIQILLVLKAPLNGKNGVEAEAEDKKHRKHRKKSKHHDKFVSIVILLSVCTCMWTMAD